MKVDDAVVDVYHNRSYTIHCQPSSDKPGRWSVWVEVFEGADGYGNHEKLLMSAEHQYTFASREEGLHSGARLAEQLIDTED